MSTILITGAATGLGNAIARATAAAGHTVYASMRGLAGKNAARAQALLDLAAHDGLNLRVVELDVTSQESADAAVATVIREQGHLDIVVNNAGRLVIGYAEAFTAEEIAALFDVNVLGQHRVNRAALPHMRARGSGYIIYIGSTSTPAHVPFMAPYVASKAAGDALAETTSFEIGPMGVETTVVLPGALTEGTEHFPDATTAADTATSAQYAALDPLVGALNDRFVGLNPVGADASPDAVGREVVRLLALPPGQRPHRTLVDYQGLRLERILDVQAQVTEEIFTRMGMSDLLTVTTPTSTSA